jgi:hypothetical protein
LLFLVITCFLFNGGAISKVFVEKQLTSKVIPIGEENESEKVDSEDEVLSHFVESKVELNDLSLLKSNTSNFCFQFANYKEVHKDFVSPPPDLY